MPLPLFLGIATAVAAAGGIGTGIRGTVKMKEANKTAKSAAERHNKNISRLELCNDRTTESMDELGAKELDILASFQQFSELFEQIHNKPEFKEFFSESVELPRYDKEEITKVSVGAGVLMGGIGGAALGTAGGFAAAGATTAAVMALGTASTGTAIASLSGVAATNATLAVLGGGALAAGGGGVALGTTMLGLATAGVGLLVGGIIFNITGSKVSQKADKAYDEMLENEKEINKICAYLNDLNRVANRYIRTLKSVDSVYRGHLNLLDTIINIYRKNDWNEFTETERLATANTVLLVQLLYKMCQVKIVLVSEDENSLNTINKTAVEDNIHVAQTLMSEHGFAGNEDKLNSDPAYEEQKADNLAMVALLYYFAKCDGSISDEESAIIDDSIRSIFGDLNESDEIFLEIKKIKSTETIEFEFLRKYLDQASNSSLNEMGALVEQVIGASEGITDSENNAKRIFEGYVEVRTNIAEANDNKDNKNKKRKKGK